MKINVRFFASLRELLGKKRESLEFTSCNEITVENALKRLTGLYGSEFTEYVLDRKTGEIQSYLTLLVNGRAVNSLGGKKAKLVNGDVLAILPPVGGG